MDCRQSKFTGEFELELRLKNRSETTIEMYCKHARLFIEWSGKQPRQVSDSDIKTYISSLYKDRYAVNSIKIKIRSLKQFYGFLYRTGQVFLDPARNIQEPNMNRLFPRSVLSNADMNAIRKAIPQTTLLSLRDKAILEVLYSTGLRLSELAGLNIMDLDLAEGMVTVRNGKGDRDRQSILNNAAMKSIKQYLNLRKQIPDDSPALWINYKGKRLSKLWIQIMIRNAARQAEVTTASNPHAWRHGLATELLRRGASIREIQVFLGHVSIRTTEIYTHMTIKDLIDVHHRTHPRERDPVPDVFDQPVCRNQDERL